jgi:hypothetical protein
MLGVEGAVYVSPVRLIPVALAGITGRAQDLKIGLVERQLGMFPPGLNVIDV